MRHGCSPAKPARDVVARSMPCPARGRADAVYVRVTGAPSALSTRLGATVPIERIGPILSDFHGTDAPSFLDLSSTRTCLDWLGPSSTVSVGGSNENSTHALSFRHSSSAL